jgi:hypothetical protein
VLPPTGIDRIPIGISGAEADAEPAVIPESPATALLRLVPLLAFGRSDD